MRTGGDLSFAGGFEEKVNVVDSLGANAAFKWSVNALKGDF